MRQWERDDEKYNERAVAATEEQEFEEREPTVESIFMLKSRELLFCDGAKQKFRDEGGGGSIEI